MRRLLVFFSALLILAIFASSDALAARPSTAHRVHAILAMFRATVFPFNGSFFFVSVDDPVMGGETEYIAGGDADDFGNGKTEPIGRDQQVVIVTSTGGDLQKLVEARK